MYITRILTESLFDIRITIHPHNDIGMRLGVTGGRLEEGTTLVRLEYDGNKYGFGDILSLFF